MRRPDAAAWLTNHTHNVRAPTLRVRALARTAPGGSARSLVQAGPKVHGGHLRPVQHFGPRAARRPVWRTQISHGRARAACGSGALSYEPAAAHASTVERSMVVG